MSDEALRVLERRGEAGDEAARTAARAARLRLGQCPGCGGEQGAAIGDAYVKDDQRRCCCVRCHGREADEGRRALFSPCADCPHR